MNGIIKIITTCAIFSLLVACDDDSSSVSVKSNAINIENVENVAYGSNEVMLRANDFSIQIVNQIFNAYHAALTPEQFYPATGFSDEYLNFQYSDLNNDGQLSAGDSAIININTRSLDPQQNYSYFVSASITVEIETMIITDSDISLSFTASSNNYSYENVAAFSPINIDRSNTNEFTLINEENIISPVSTISNEFSLAGIFKIDFNQVKQDNTITQTIQTISENVALDYVYSENDLILFSDQFEGELQLTNFFTRSLVDQTNSIFRISDGPNLPTATSFTTPILFSHQNEFYVSAELHSLQENITFSFVTSENLISQAETPIPYILFSDGKILFNSDKSFATQFNQNGEWLIQNDQDTFIAPVNFSHSSSFANTLTPPSQPNCTAEVDVNLACMLDTTKLNPNTSNYSF